MTWNLNISVALYDNFIFFWVNAIGFLDSELIWIWVDLDTYNIDIIT